MTTKNQVSFYIDISLPTEKLKIPSLVNYGNVNDVYLYHYYELSAILLILIGGNAMIVFAVVGTHFNAQIEYISHILWLPTSMHLCDLCVLECRFDGGIGCNYLQQPMKVFQNDK